MSETSETETAKSSICVKCKWHHQSDLGMAHQCRFDARHRFDYVLGKSVEIPVWCDKKNPTGECPDFEEKE